MASSRFEKFSERARRVLTLAQEEARQFNHSYIGTEHLLLGLVREEEGVAAKVLINLGADLAKIRSAVEFTMGRGEKPSGSEIGLTPRAKRVIELAIDEARHLGHSYIGTEHLLLGLLREGGGVAVSILDSFSINVEQVRAEVIRVLSQGGGQQAKGAGSKSRVASRSPVLDQVSIDLTEAARSGKLDPVIGRDKEIERVTQILSRRTKNNPALIGEPGVGKTAIVEGLAHRINIGDVPETLLGKRLVTLDIASLVAGTKYRGEFEERLKKVLEEIKSAANIVLFIDEFHTIVGAGAAEGAVDAANILKPSLARGELQCIGASTLDDFRKHIEKDPALERRFQPVLVEEPSVEDTIRILQGVRSRYEDHHKLTISDESLKAAANLASRYISDRFLPDKAIDLVDVAASRVRIKHRAIPAELKEGRLEEESVRKKKDEALATQRYDEAAELRQRELQMEEKNKQLEEKWQKARDEDKPVVTAENIAEVVAQWTGVPVVQLAGNETERLLHMEEVLHKRIIGQDESINIISKAVRRARAGLKDPRHPIGNFIFLGPTGVGKTELARSLAEFMFGSEDALVRIDMSEFMEKFAVSRLVGAPPGYVGYEEGGQLTEAVRRKSYCCILLDEIEKAHPDVFNILLQIFDDGHLTDAKGRRVDFRNAIIIMTSNIGAETIRKGSNIGFATQADEAKQAEQSYERMKDKLLVELKRSFRPEFLNRIDGVVVFHPLNKENIRSIVDLMLKQVNKELEEKGIKLSVTDAAKDFLGKKGYDEAFGARPLRRVIQSLVEDRLSEDILRGRFLAEDTANIDLLGEELVVYTQLEQQVKEKEINLVVTEPVKDFIAKDNKKGYDELRRVQELILSQLDSGDTVLVEMQGDEMTFRKQDEPEPVEAR